MSFSTPSVIFEIIELDIVVVSMFKITVFRWNLKKEFCQLDVTNNVDVHHLSHFWETVLCQGNATTRLTATCFCKTSVVVPWFYAAILPEKLQPRTKFSAPCIGHVMASSGSRGESLPTTCVFKHGSWSGSGTFPYRSQASTQGRSAGQQNTYFFREKEHSRAVGFGNGLGPLNLD